MDARLVSVTSENQGVRASRARGGEKELNARTHCCGQRRNSDEVPYTKCSVSSAIAVLRPQLPTQIVPFPLASWPSMSLLVFLSLLKPDTGRGYL